MALFVKKVQDAEEAEKLDERDEVLQGLKTQCCTSMKWKPISLETLFGSTKPTPACSLQMMEEEEAMMQAMVEADEDERTDDGAVEILSHFNPGSFIYYHLPLAINFFLFPIITYFYPLPTYP